MITDDLTITCGEVAVTGWTDIRVTRGIERLPSDFDIGLTELYPGETDKLVIEPGMACQVRIGDDLVVTGYVDCYSPAFGPESHSVRITGRSKCADLVDCAVEWQGGQISNATVLGIAQKIGSVYGPEINGKAEGIPVTTDVEGLPVLPQVNVMLGESGFEIIDRMARGSAVLAYDLPDGGLHLTRVGGKKASSGFAEGVNVEHAYVVYSMSQRYSKYRVYIQSTQTFMDLGDGGNLIAVVSDPNVKRNRGMTIIAEGGDPGNGIAIQRANWEMARRAGRSRVVRVVVDSWRDASGALWEPNTLASVTLESLKIKAEELLISEVTFLRNASGTRAEITLMAPEAFLPQPINLTPLWGDLSGMAR